MIPIRSDMNLQEDVRGLMKLPTTWEEYEPTHRPPLPDPTRASHDQPPHPAAKKREQTRQQTLARQQAERRREIAAGPEPRSRANLDRSLPESDELVGLSGAA